MPRTHHQSYVHCCSSLEASVAVLCLQSKVDYGDYDFWRTIRHIIDYKQVCMYACCNPPQASGSSPVWSLLSCGCTLVLQRVRQTYIPCCSHNPLHLGCRMSREPHSGQAAWTEPSHCCERKCKQTSAWLNLIGQRIWDNTATCTCNAMCTNIWHWQM